MIDKTCVLARACNAIENISFIERIYKSPLKFDVKKNIIDNIDIYGILLEINICYPYVLVQDEKECLKNYIDSLVDAKRQLQLVVEAADEK